VKIDIDGTRIHVATGGMPHRPGQPFMLFLHGAGFTHHSFVLQTRALAHEGWNVAAPDLPGHGLSGGRPLGTVEEMAAFVLSLMDRLAIPSAVIAGHSMGGLIALEIARTAPERVDGLVLIGTAASIPVNPKLIETAEKQEEQAFLSMNSWGYGPQAHLAENTWPGANHVAFGLAVMRGNAGGALAAGLKACAAYVHGEEAARSFAGPAIVAVAEFDRMTPNKNGLALAGLLKNSRSVFIRGSGHTIQTEKPRELNAALREFLARLRQPARAAG
jgi:pimeloyl-ACP methyl ester carboxylesterase